MISVIIPVYNSEKSIEILCTSISKNFNKLSIQYEIILVDDFSFDDSWLVIKKICRTHMYVKGIKLSQNFGQHNALFCGIIKSNGELIVTLDDDLQHNPEEIFKLLEKIDEGFDLVYGNSKSSKQSLNRGIITKVSKFLIKKFIGIKNINKISPFRVFKSKLKYVFNNQSNNFINIDVLLSWATNKIGFVEVSNSERQFGLSNYKKNDLINYTLNLIISFSTRPLRYSSLLGFIIATFGITTFGYVIFTWFFYGSVVRGFPFLASIICIFSGTQLIVLGIIGEYIAKIHMSNMNKQSYNISEELNINDTIQ